MLLLFLYLHFMILEYCCFIMYAYVIIDYLLSAC